MNMRAHYNTDRTERGVALVAVMLTLLLVSAMAAAIIILANTETNTSSNFKDEQRAFFSAKAGVEEARDRLVTGTAGYTLATLPTTLPGVGSTGVLYILNPLGSETVAPWCAGSSSSSGVSATCQKEYPDDELCKEALAASTTGSTGTVTCTTDSTTGKKYASGSYYLATVNASTTLQPSSGPVLDWKWARITLKQSNAFGTGYYVNGSSSSASQTYWNGNNECTSGVSPCNLPVYVVTALAVTASGSRRMVQMEVARDQLIFNAPAALTLDGTSDQFTGGQGNGWSVVGTDTAVAGCGGSTGSAVPAIGVLDGSPATGNGKGANAASGDIANVINGYGTGTGIPNKNISDYVGLGASPDVENISSSTSLTTDKLDSYSDLTSLVSTLKNDVTQPVVASGSSYSGGGAAFNSSATHPQIVYANGDLTLGGSLTGYGILVVTGTLTMHGSATWNGLVLVIGKGILQTDGGVNYNGAVVVANTSSGSIGQPTFNVNGGGGKNGQVAYSSGCIAQATQLTTYHSVSFRELMN
jgi:hypothetical protein